MFALVAFIILSSRLLTHSSASSNLLLILLWCICNVSYIFNYDWFFFYIFCLFVEVLTENSSLGSSEYLYDFYFEFSI